MPKPFETTPLLLSNGSLRQPVSTIDDLHITLLKQLDSLFHTTTESENAARKEKD